MPKKVLSRFVMLLLCSVIVFSLSSCKGKSSSDDAKDLVGLWKYELNGDLRDIITEVIADSDVYVDIYYLFNEDGTGRTYASDNSYDREFTYTYSNGTITITSNGYSFDQKCKLDGDRLTVHDDEQDNDVVFIRQR